MSIFVGVRPFFFSRMQVFLALTFSQTIWRCDTKYPQRFLNAGVSHPQLHNRRPDSCSNIYQIGWYSRNSYHRRHFPCGLFLWLSSSSLVSQTSYWHLQRRIDISQQVWKLRLGSKRHCFSNSSRLSWETFKSLYYAFSPNAFASYGSLVRFLPIIERYQLVYSHPWLRCLPR